LQGTTHYTDTALPPSDHEQSGSGGGRQKLRISETQYRGAVDHDKVEHLCADRQQRIKAVASEKIGGVGGEGTRGHKGKLADGRLLHRIGWRAGADEVVAEPHRIRTTKPLVQGRVTHVGVDEENSLPKQSEMPRD